MTAWDATDSHFTPVPVGLQLTQSLRASGWTPKRVLDLGAGAGSLAEAARLTWPDAEIIAVEVRAEEARHLRRWCDDVLIADALALDRTLASLEPELLLSNPPYRKAFRFTRLSLQLHAKLVALLHRSTFGSHATVHDFMERHPPTLDLGIGGRPRWRWRRSPDKVPHDWRLWSAARTGDWRRRLLPRLPGTLLTWEERPGTEAVPPALLAPDMLLDLTELLP